MIAAFAIDVRKLLGGFDSRCNAFTLVRWKQNTNVPEVRGERVTPLRRCLFPDRLEYVNAAGVKRDPLKCASFSSRAISPFYLSTTFGSSIDEIS